MQVQCGEENIEIRLVEAGEKLVCVDAGICVAV